MAELIFIGTSSGKTSVNRFHSSFLISTSNYNLLIDAGDGISKALLTQQVSYDVIDGILFSHLHPDHYTGMATLIVQMKMIERKKTLDVFINSELADVIRNFLIQSYLFPEKIGFAIEYHPLTDNVKFKINDDISFIPRQNSHLSSVSKLEDYKSRSYSSSSFLLRVDDKNIHYTSDVGEKNDLQLFRDKTIDCLISEVTHINPEDIITAFDKSALPGRIILTHISDDDLISLQKFILELPEHLKERIIIASDGLKIKL
ncbi:MAG: MBL fold metallo-hydrolase [Bacteroidetes bacterium]|nr:MBL fold metallo-hydrolase [Bacteroidota bacterium]